MALKDICRVAGELPYEVIYLNNQFSHLKSGENHRQELFQALNAPSSYDESTQRLIFLTEISHVLSGILTSGAILVDESEHGLILSKNERYSLIEEIKRLSPQRNRNKDSFTGAAAIIQELLFEQLKTSSTDIGANKLLNQVLAKKNKESIEKAYIKARASQLSNELEIFYSYASRLLISENLTKQILPPQIIELFKNQRDKFLNRMTCFSEHRTNFHPVYSQEQGENVHNSLAELSNFTNLYNQFRPTFLTLYSNLTELEFAIFPLNTSALENKTVTNYQNETITISRGKANALLDNFRTKGYINDLGILQPAYSQALSSKVNVFEDFSDFSNFRSGMVRLIENATNKQKTSYSISNLLDFLSTLLPETSSAQCMYLLIALLYTEQHLLSLFPNSYSETRQTCICSNKTAHFFLFLYLYFLRLSAKLDKGNKPNHLNCLIEELFVDYLASVLSAEYSSPQLRNGLYLLKESLAEHHIKALYSSDLKNEETINLLGERLKLYMNDTIKVNGISQHFSQEQVAQLLESTQQEISTITLGNKKFFSPALLVKISKETGG